MGRDAGIRGRCFFVGLSVLSLLLGGVSRVQAQLRISHEFIPISRLKQDIPGLPGSRNAEFTLHTSEFSLGIPVIFSVVEGDGQKTPGRFLLNKIRYQLRQVKRENVPGITTPFLVHTETLHNLGYQATWTEPFSPKWTLLVLGGVYMSVDETKGVGMSDLDLQMGLLLRRRLSSGWEMGLGGFFTQVTGKDRILPLVQVMLFNEVVAVHLLGPTFSFFYKVTPAFSVGIYVELEGEKYRLVNTQADLYDEQGSLVKQNVDVGLSYSVLTAGPSVQATRSNFALRLEGGLSTARVFEFKATGERETLRFGGGSVPASIRGERMDFDLKNSLYIKAVFKYGVSFKLE